MNDKLLSKYDKTQNKKAIKMLKELQSRIQKGQLVTVTSGFWEGANGKWNFNVVTRETDDFRPFTEL